MNKKLRELRTKRDRVLGTQNTLRKIRQEWDFGNRKDFEKFLKSLEDENRHDYFVVTNDIADCVL